MSKFLSCKEANQLDLVDYLSALGFTANKIRGNDYWYLSPLRDEKTASFKIHRGRNIWYDHGLGKGGTVIDFGKEYFKCSVLEFLGKVEEYTRGTVSFHRHPLSNAGEKKVEKIQPGKIIVLKSQAINNPELIEYLQTRKISLDIARRFCSEILFSLYDKKFTAIGFKNNAGGYELRNEKFKGSSSPKACTLIEKSSSENLAVFEGFFNFLSFETLRENPSSKLLSLPEMQQSFLVLNSLSFFEKSREQMENFNAIHLYLDRDNMGIKRTQDALKWSMKYVDKSNLYKNFKDLNEMLVRSFKNELRQSPGKGLRF